MTVYLITGGTGSLARALIPRLAVAGNTVRLFARNEHSHEEIALDFEQFGPRLRHFIGDVRDYDRLLRACEGVDIVIHAAALKIVPTCEYNPTEAEQTNVGGTRNVIAACLRNNVSRAVFISTDKAVEPVTLYGSTKCAAEHLWRAANSYRGGNHPTLFTSVRYGNVTGSRGSILPLLLQQRTTGTITVTDPKASRFWLPISKAVDIILFALEHTRGGEVWIPTAPSMTVGSLIEAIAPDCKVKLIGLRANEKMHECLITTEELRRCRDAGDWFVIEPEAPNWKREPFTEWPKVKTFTPRDYVGRYASDTNTWLVPKEQFLKEAEAVK